MNQSRSGNGTNGGNNKEERIIPLDRPLAVVYSDSKKIFLKDGEAYKIAGEMGNIPPHQLRKILNEVKSANQMSKKGDFEGARNKLYYTVPLTAYNAGRITALKSLYKFVVRHINEQTLTNKKDIEVLDQLFTSIIAYHKYFTELKKRENKKC